MHDCCAVCAVWSTGKKLWSFFSGLNEFGGALMTSMMQLEPLTPAILRLCSGKFASNECRIVQLIFNSSPPFSSWNFGIEFSLSSCVHFSISDEKAWTEKSTKLKIASPPTQVFLLLSALPFSVQCSNSNVMKFLIKNLFLVNFGQSRTSRSWMGFCLKLISTLWHENWEVHCNVSIDGQAEGRSCAAATQSDQHELLTFQITHGRTMRVTGDESEWRSK